MDALGFLLALVLLAGLPTGGWAIRKRYRRARIERIRDQARLRVVENQMAALRAALRISVAEHVVRRAMAMQSRDLFENRTDQEKYHSS